MTDYRALIRDPNVRAVLDMIARAEGVKHEYNTGFGNVFFPSLAAHPRDAVKGKFKQTDGKTNTSRAAGRYQFLPKTWDMVVSDLKARGVQLSDFGEEAQDIAALRLIEKRGALGDVLKGDWKPAIDKLGGEWASLPSSRYPQNRRSWQFVMSHLPGGERFKPSQAPVSPAASAGNTPSAAGLPAVSLSSPPAMADALTDPFGGLVPAPIDSSDWKTTVKQLQTQANRPTALQRMEDSAIEQDAYDRSQRALSAVLGEPALPSINFPVQIEDAIDRYLERL
jgi:muramidase (phage lysozyme)